MTEEPQHRDQSRKPLRGDGRILLAPAAALDVRILSITTRGVAVVSSANLPAGSNCTLEFSIPHEGRRESFKVPAEVVAAVLSADADGFRLNLRFSGAVAESMRLAIERFLLI